MVGFPLPFHVFIRWPTCGSSALKGSFPSYGQENALTSTRSPVLILLALGRGRIHIPGFIQSPPTLAVYEVRSLLLGGVDKDLSFTEDETRTFLISLWYF